ncbi:MAG: hypothetical protein CMO55_27000 [Verrucomicrobiales bacterium]|nr:hypothetical protein [Verrucomicrobiales bacterium]
MEEESREVAKPNQKSGGSPWGKVFLLFVILVVSGLVVFLSFIWLGKKGIDSTKETVIEVANLFKPEKVIETFEEWKELTATGTEGNILEVATAEASERFSRKTNLNMFGKTLPLGTTVSEITVPATYRFHINLKDEWFVTSDGSRLMVLAPKIRPSLPVAFDTGKMQKKTKSGWARWDGAENLDELEKSLTAKLSERAQSEETIAEVREESRVAVAKFVRDWLIGSEEWGKGRFEEITVLFPGESGQSLSSSPPTLTVDGESVLP